MADARLEPYAMPVSRASKQRKRRRRKHAETRGSSVPPGFVVAESPLKRLPGFFQLLENVTRTADRACAARPDQLTRADVFDIAVFVRAINLLKASRTLLADGHWEVATSATRQLFELLVNMEYLTTRPDPDDERLRYAKWASAVLKEPTSHDGLQPVD